MAKEAKFKNKKREKREKLQELFIYDAELLENALEAMSQALIAFCSEDEERKVRYSKKCIAIEEEQDDVRDDIIKRREFRGC